MNIELKEIWNSDFIAALIILVLGFVLPEIRDFFKNLGSYKTSKFERLCNEHHLEQTTYEVIVEKLNQMRFFNVYKIKANKNKREAIAQLVNDSNGFLDSLNFKRSYDIAVYHESENRFEAKISAEYWWVTIMLTFYSFILGVFDFKFFEMLSSDNITSSAFLASFVMVILISLTIIYVIFNRAHKIKKYFFIKIAIRMQNQSNNKIEQNSYDIF